MAEEAEYADEGHQIEFRAMQVRSVLNRSSSKRLLSLAYSINPYRGCEFGCKYCYARYTHEFLAPAVRAENQTSQEGNPDGVTSNPSSGINFRDPEAFERRIFIKQNAAWLLEQELKKIDPAQEIAIGTATDPYQPIERRERVTRSILEVFARKSGYRIGIITKSRLIEHDVDLLQEIARRNRLVVHLTITTADAALARILEPRAPRPDLRLAAVQRLRDAGIVTGILCSPLLPGITDSANALEEMAQQAAAVGASFFAAQPLFLKSCSRPSYLSFVREHFPALEADYAVRFSERDFAAPEYRRKLASMVTEACRKYGLRERLSDALLTRDAGIPRRAVESVRSQQQQKLFA
ncbi:MAG: Radical domain protein [Acidobacteriaceae bacterium]|nr:Radical domain protein [Acidobacteriaceae bacterium]